MENSTGLFRQQAVNHSSNKLYGDVVAVPHLPHTVFLILTLSWLSYLSYISLSMEWKETESVAGKVISQNTRSVIIELSDSKLISFLNKNDSIDLQLSQAQGAERSTDRNVGATIDHLSGDNIHARLEDTQHLPEDVTVTLVTGHQNIIEWVWNRSDVRGK